MLKMKKLTVIRAVSVLILSLTTSVVACQQETPPTQAPFSPTSPPITQTSTIQIEDAINKGLVVAHIRGTNASSGDSIEATFELKADAGLEIVVPAGTVLKPSDAAQNMVIRRLTGIPTGPTTFRPVSKISLPSGTDVSETYLFEAYCLDFDRANPTSSTTFLPVGLASETIQAILNCGDKTNASMGAIQAAIWAVTYNVQKTELLSRFLVTASDLEKARQLLECAGVNTNVLQLFR